jgi:ATP-dependent Lhr-like helicase
MEDAGTVRRGYFVESLEGAQFAWPGAVDRLREAPRGGQRAEVVAVIAAVDPACAWGSVLPWPELRDPAARPARRVGATAILVDGELAVWAEPRGKRLATGALPPEAIELALAVGLPRIAAKARRRELLVEAIDGVAAPESPLARALIAAGARTDYRGLVIRAPVPGLGPPSAPAAAPSPAADAGDDDDDLDPGG